MVHAEMEHRCNVVVPERTSRLGFAQKTASGGLAYTTECIHDLQGDWTFQISVIGLESDTHIAPAQFPQLSIGAPNYFIVLVQMSHPALLF
jgi:hypothetical protein